MADPQPTPKFESILLKNKKLDFVQRILDPQNYGVVRNPDGSVSTHSMAAETVEGKGGKLRHVSFPTVVRGPDRQLRRLPL